MDAWIWRSGIRGTGSSIKVNSATERPFSFLESNAAGQKTGNGRTIANKYSTEELNGLDDWQLYRARGELYARHGMIFDDKDTQKYFEGCNWYEAKHKSTEFEVSLLNGVEKRNLVNIRALEELRNSIYVGKGKLNSKDE